MDVGIKPIKPLGHKSYGSIPHLPGSRLGIGDHHIEQGQAKIANEKVRDKHDRVIVQEKLDGSNVGVAKINGEILALTRAGYLATTSPYLQHQYFSQWVDRNKGRFDSVLKDGERICGEWLAQAHGTKYDLPHEPFVAFDLIIGKERLCYEQMQQRLSSMFILPNLIGFGPMSISDAMEKLGYGDMISYNPHGAVEQREGAIWRVERKGVVDFLTKYVHHNKEDGKYLPENNGTGHPIWNVDISEFTADIRQHL